MADYKYTCIKLTIDYMSENVTRFLIQIFFKNIAITVPNLKTREFRNSWAFLGVLGNFGDSSGKFIGVLGNFGEFKGIMSNLSVFKLGNQIVC